MLSTKYQNIYRVISEEISFDNSLLTKCLLYVQELKDGAYVYSENLIERFKLIENQSLELLSLLTREKILQKVFRIYCPHCGHFHHEPYYSISEVMEFEICDNCGRELNIDTNPFKYLVIYFKKYD